jgi:hypothetical protein
MRNVEGKELSRRLSEKGRKVKFNGLYSVGQKHSRISSYFERQIRFKFLQKTLKFEEQKSSD